MSSTDIRLGIVESAKFNTPERITFNSPIKNMPNAIIIAVINVKTTAIFLPIDKFLYTIINNQIISLDLIYHNRLNKIMIKKADSYSLGIKHPEIKKQQPLNKTTK
ncbi:hypothetical protein [uncultured Photobacterium sp.]|uniref:hypothetical protein n=1 Tax=uncultured Photobacterium sp. TaxID=173973 RepID=UPI0026034E17|nr:hypothetical protein [uncultured Photobacterium sp.]